MRRGGIVKPLLETRDLYLAFGGLVVADHIDFQLHRGERLAVIGQNGAGKTTFINICTGYLKPQSGDVWFGDRRITAMPPRRIVLLGMGRSFQLPQLFTEHTVRECVQIAAASQDRRLSFLRAMDSVVDRSEVESTLELVGLREDARRMSSDLPEGKRKLLDIAMALVLHPQLLIMDEPTSGVASEDKHDLMRIIMSALDQRHVTSWFVEHDVDIVARYATRVAAWISGAIVADGMPDGVLQDPRIRSEILGA